MTDSENDDSFLDDFRYTRVKSKPEHTLSCAKFEFVDIYIKNVFLLP